MKPLQLFNLAFSIVIVSASTLYAQTIRIVDNNFNPPTGSLVYATLQEAQDASIAGDIIQVQPSPNKYGDIVIDRPIVLQGIGFNLDKDNPLQSTISNVTFTNRADGSSDASGSHISGLTTDNIFLGFVTGSVNYTLSNVTIENCDFGYVSNNSSGYTSVDNISVLNCQNRGGISVSGFGLASIYFFNDATNTTIQYNLLSNAVFFRGSTAGITNNEVKNNILYTLVRVDAQGTNTLIANNNFIGDGGDRAFDVLRDCIITNNIFYGSTPSNVVAGGSTSTNFQRNIFSYNISFSTGNDELPPSGGPDGNTGSPNFPGFSTQIFTDVPLSGTWSSSNDFTYTGGQVGSDGNDIGISGGPDPYVGTNFELKTASVPVIQILNTSTVINPGDDLPVRVKANSN